MKRTKPTKKEKIQVFTEALNRLNIANRLGVSYSGARDLYDALGYKKEIDYPDYLAKYTRQDIAASVIDKPVETTWRGDVNIEVGVDKETGLEKEWNTLYDDLKLKSKFQRADKLSAIGRFSILFLGFDDADSTNALQLEVEEGQRKLVYVKPFSEGQATIKTYVTDPTNARYGLPLLYEIILNETDTILVNHTRIIHITGKILDSEIYGIPMMQRVYNRLDDLEKITGGSAEMYWRGARPGFQGKVDSDFQMGPELSDELQKQMNEYDNGLRRLIVNEGVDLQSLASQVSDPSNHVDVQLQMIAAGTNIPVRILIGSERGELASTQDQNNWYDYISVRRQEHAEPNILRPFITLCQKYKVLPEISEDESYAIKWEDLYTTSDQEKAEIGKTRATALKEYTSNPAAEMIIPPEMFLKYFLGLDDSEIEIIMEAFENLETDVELTPEEQAIIDAEVVVENQPIEEE